MLRPGLCVGHGSSGASGNMSAHYVVESVLLVVDNTACKCILESHDNFGIWDSRVHSVINDLLMLSRSIRFLVC